MSSQLTEEEYEQWSLRIDNLRETIIRNNPPPIVCKKQEINPIHLNLLLKIF